MLESHQEGYRVEFFLFVVKQRNLNLLFFKKKNHFEGMMSSNKRVDILYRTRKN